MIQQRDRIQAEFNTLEDRWADGEGEAGVQGMPVWGFRGLRGSGILESDSGSSS